MNPFLSGALLTLLVCLLGPARAEAAPRVVVISLDGVRHDYPDKADLPALVRMEEQGLRAGRMRPVFPSSTFPNHVSLATGTYPDRHGIVDNRFWDRERGLYDYDKGEGPSWLKAEPLWVTAERQGVTAATLFWVGSRNAWNGVSATYRRKTFDGRVSERAKVDQILEWVDLPEGDRPGLIMSWWHGADRAGHQFGPDSAEVVEALEEQDAELGRLLAGLDARQAWSELTLLVVSDHGMLAVEGSVALAERFEAAGISARVQHGTAVAHIFLDDPTDRDRAQALIAQDPGLQVYRMGELPEALRLAHPQRTGDLVVLVDPPRSFSREEFLPRVYFGARRLWKPEARQGKHGYAPDHPAMGAIFFALGRGVEVGFSPGEVRSVDVAPTVTRLLGIDPPMMSEGTPVAGVGGRLGRTASTPEPARVSRSTSAQD
ncbi:MAG: ectonucleotide pyrophosphatase/phosphodiesterase [Myxococcota bacterium]|nr:ectonucleotide pyrophosphatase/phosphodiesterase [Myxococcota bacterium]